MTTKEAPADERSNLRAGIEEALDENCDGITAFVPVELLHGLLRALEEPEQGAALSERAAPDGWKLVPVEPTKAMRRAGTDAWRVQNDCHLNQLMGKVYRAMLAASPAQPAAAVPAQVDEDSEETRL